MALCTRTDPHPCSYGCELRQKGIQLSPAATPNRRLLRPDPGVAKPKLSWEAGVVTERRVDGSQMPVLEPGTRHPIGVKQYGENRRAFDEQRKRLKTIDRPLALKGA